MMAADLLSSASLRAIAPSAAMLPAFLAALMEPAARMSSMAFSMSPPAAVRAFLQSIMPWPVRSRSSLTRAAVISAMFAILLDRFLTIPPVTGDQFFKWQKGGLAPFLRTEQREGLLSLLRLRKKSSLG